MAGIPIRDAGAGRGRGRGRGGFGSTPAPVRPTPVDPAQQYSYVGAHVPPYTDDPVLLGLLALDYYTDNGEAMGLGTIIWTYMYEYYEPGVNSEDPDPESIHTFTTPGEESCLQKLRPLIVVRKKRDIIIALPMYTYSGNGLTGKPPWFPRIHLRVRDLRKEGNAPQEERRILAAENVADGDLIAKLFGSARENYLYPNSHCRFDYPVTFNLKNKPVMVLGQLTDFVRHHQHAAEQLRAPPTPPAPNNVNDGSDDDGDGNDNGNGDGPANGLDPNDSDVGRTAPRRPAVASGPQTRSRSLRDSSRSGPAQTNSHTGTAGERPLTEMGTQTSPGLGLSKLTLASPGKRRRGEEADGHSSGGSSKRQNRSSGTRDLIELDDAGRPRRQSQIRSGSAAEPGAMDQKNYTDVNNASQVAVVAIENHQNSNMESPPVQPNAMAGGNVAPDDRERALMRAAFKKRGNESSLEEDFISAALSYNNNQLLHHIRLLTVEGRTDASIASELVRKIGFPGSIGTWGTLDGTGAGLPSVISLEEKDIKIAMQVFNVERDVGISIMQPGVGSHLVALKDIRSRYPKATEDRIVSLFNTAVEDLAGRSTSRYSTNKGIQQDDLGPSEEIARVMRIFKLTHQKAINFNNLMGGDLLGVLEMNRAQFPQETEEQVVKRMKDYAFRVMGEDEAKGEIDARRQRA